MPTKRMLHLAWLNLAIASRDLPLRCRRLAVRVDSPACLAYDRFGVLLMRSRMRTPRLIELAGRLDYVARDRVGSDLA